MNRASLEALVRRNAEACENATSQRCRCLCAGTYHGKRHGEKWIRAALDELEQHGNAEPELPL